MESLHFAAIEAGRVTPLCGGRPATRLSWTTKRAAVTCARCRALLDESDAENGWDELQPAQPERAAGSRL